LEAFSVTQTKELKMSRFVFVNSILPGKTEKVKEIFKEIKDNVDHRQELQDRADAHNIMGISLLNAWVQHTPKGDLLIQCYEGSSPEIVLGVLRAGIEAKAPLALRERDFHLAVTGEDFSDPASTPKITEVMSLEFPANRWKSDKHFSIGFAHPLLKGKTEAHEKFCAQEKGKDFEKISKLLKSYDITTFIKFIQKTPEQDYIVYYCEFPERVYERVFNSSDKHLRAENKDLAYSEEWKWIAKTLQEHTGLTAEQLFPDIESLGCDQISVELAFRPG